MKAKQVTKRKGDLALAMRIDYCLFTAICVQ
jgi:hypothetical protein